MRKWLLLAVLFLPALSWANSCTTTFPLTANPIGAGQCGAQTWKNGGTDGLDWSNIRVTGGSKAWGTQVPSGLGQNDSVAILNGTWSTNQMAQATVLFNGSVGNENELFLHATVAAHSLTGYEVTCSLGYVFVAKWLGPLNSNTQLVFDNTKHCSNNDVFTAIATTSGSTVTIKAYVNGVLQVTGTDSSSAFTGGNPGIGQWIGSADNLNNAGETDYFASDQVVLAATASQADVNAVINGGTHTAVDGDTIVIPSGSSTWTSGVTINGVGITIIGFGKPQVTGGLTGAGTSLTALTDHANGPLFSFTNLAFGKTARVSTLTMSASGAGSNSISSPITFSGTCVANGCAQVRVDNINFTAGTWETPLSGGFVIVDNVFGVVDHTTSSESKTASPALVQINYGAWQGVGHFGDKSFGAADTFGTGQTFYIENNSMDGVRGSENDVSSIGDVGGARYACRFNNVTNMSGTGVCSAHGTAWSGRPRGQRQVEVYYNTVACVIATGCNGANGLNSGTGYYLSNTYSIPGGGLNAMEILDIARFVMTSAPWNNCDGTQPWDQSPFSTSSACLDQPGSGQGALLQTSTPVLASSPGTPCTTLGQCWPNPTLDPVYEAGETATNAATPVSVQTDGSSTRVLANRDFYAEVSQTAQTSASSPFNGTTGTGYGTFARRPATCTTGVGYWATDTGTWNVSGSASNGTLYICTSTNTWTSSYTPYAYPHPLISGVAQALPGVPSANLQGSIKAAGAVVLK